MKQRLTMADIGRLAGVSASTVSRALSGSPSIPSSTRERIRKLALEHNYILDVQAQNFRLQRSRTVATLLPYSGRSGRLISDPFYMEIIGAIADELDQFGHDLIVARVPSDEDDWCSHYVMNKRVDGVLLIDRALHDSGIDRLQALGANFVVWGGVVNEQNYVSVGGDGVEGGRLAVQHLAALGRRRIGFVGGNGGMVETYLRRQGYERGLRESDLPFDERLIMYTDFSPRAGVQAVAELLDRAPDLDGVFVCSDFMSIAAMEVLRERGRRVPGDISVVGYDDIQLAAYCSPRLTTIRQQVHEGGRLMVQKLFALIEGEPAASAVLPLELVVRDSCGANAG
jgi:DNA-binding LacI/PurR family transcriptional regulator